MKRTKYDGTDSRLVLSAMIFNQVVCARIASQWSKSGLFDSDWANLVGSWCVQYIRKFGHPPKDKIINKFQIWAQDNVVSDEVLNSIEKFIQSLSENEANGDADGYILEVAGKLFNRVRLQKEIQEAQLDIKQGLIEDAQNRLTRFQRVELGPGSFIEPAEDPSVWISAFEQDRSRPLITYPGDLGLFIGDSFARGRLFAWMSPDKSGKTLWLLDAAYRAARSRRRVAFFDMGDSVQEEIMVRLACRSLREPEFKKIIEVPIDWTDDGVVFDSIQFNGVEPIKGFRKFKKICRSEDSFRLTCYENSTITVDGINSILDDWARSNWRPSVIIIDYADIIAPPSGSKDVLDGIDEIWKQLRRMSQNRYCLVLTATQSNAAVYGKEEGLLGRKSFSGRKTKLAHVNGMLGINVSTEERKKGMSRINWIVRRKGGYSEKSYVKIVGCPDFSMPVALSRMR